MMNRIVLPAICLLFYLGLAQLHAGIEPVSVIVPCENGEEWEGGETDTEVRMVGDASIRWRHADHGSISLVDCPADWTAGSAIRLRLHNAVATKSSFMFIVTSENGNTEGSDYWMHRVDLDFTGWREIVVPRRAMGAARRPLGWDKVNKVFLTATGWDQKLDPRAVVNIDQVELVDMVGPRTSDEDLFSVLDLTLPGLETAQTAAAAKDWPAAVKALASYYRQRTSVPWSFDPHRIDRKVRFDKGAAEDAVAARISIINVTHEFPNGEIDWFYNPTIARPELARNYEWQWQMGRMGNWGNLGRAYWATGDERYAQTFVRQMRSWARHCIRPDDSGNGAGSAWRTIECGIRMGYSWPESWHRFLHSPSFTDEDMALYLKVCYEHALHLVEHRTTGNWLTMEMSGLYTIGAVFPEFRDAESWRKLAADMLYQELETQFLPDGAQVELTTGYHQVALGNVLKIPKTAKLVGRLDELPKDYVARAERAYGFNLKMMTPNRDLPHTNDAWHVNVPGSLRGAFSLFPHRTDFQWIATDGNGGTIPDFTSILLPYAGFAVMRSGWETDANYLLFDGGLLGYGHYHQDKLQVVVHAYGREMLYDGGGGNYESSKWRRYSTDTFGHSTAIVDGKPQRRGSRNRWDNVSKVPLPIVWRSGEAFDYAAASYDESYGEAGNQPATHRREVLFIKPDLFLVVDRFEPNDEKEHSYDVRWQVDSTTAQPTGTPGGFVSTDAGKPNLAIVPLAIEGLKTEAVSAQEEPEMLGWLVRKNGGHEHTTTVRHQCAGAGPKQVVTLLVPLRPGDECPVRTVRSEDGVFLAETGDWRLRIRLLPEGLEVRQTDGDGVPLRVVSTTGE